MTTVETLIETDVGKLDGIFNEQVGEFVGDFDVVLEGGHSRGLAITEPSELLANHEPYVILRRPSPDTQPEVSEAVLRQRRTTDSASIGHRVVYRFDNQDTGPTVTKRDVLVSITSLRERVLRDDVPLTVEDYALFNLIFDTVGIRRQEIEAQRVKEATAAARAAARATGSVVLALS